MRANAPRRRPGWLRVAAVGLLALPAPARAETPASTEDSKRECVAQHEQSQVLRNEGRLIEAQSSLRLCSQQSCPAAIREDCVQWFEEVRRAVPSVVVTAHSGDSDQIDVRVFIDGRLVASRLDGQPLDLNPGSHKFRFECAGFQPVERQVLLAPSDKMRTIAVTFTPLASAEPAVESTGEPAAGPTSAPTKRSTSSIPTLAYVSAGAVLVGAAGFATFGLWGLDQRSNLQNTCKPACEDSKVKSVRTKFVLADVSLGVSIAAAVATGILLFSPSKTPPPSTNAKAAGHGLSASVDVGPQGSTFMRLQGEF